MNKEYAIKGKFVKTNRRIKPPGKISEILRIIKYSFNTEAVDRDIRKFTQSIQMKPDDAASYYYRGLAYRCKGESERAKNDFSKYISMLLEQIGDEHGIKKNNEMKQTKEPKPSGRKCEKCGEEMLIREGGYGKFLACSAYPKCANIEPYKEDSHDASKGHDSKTFYDTDMKE